VGSLILSTVHQQLTASVQFTMHQMAFNSLGRTASSFQVRQSSD